MNYLFLGGRFNLKYMYIDLEANSQFVADSLFYKRKIPVKFQEEMQREGDKYILVFCKIKRKYKEVFEEALAEIKHKMDLLGHLDYKDYCENFMKEIGAEG